MEWPQVLHFRKLFLQALSVRSLELDNFDLLQQCVTLRELSKQPCEVSPLLRGNLCRGRVLCGGAVAQGKDGAVCARHTEVVFARQVSTKSQSSSQMGEALHRQR